jgi:hypothetical protein
VVEAFGVPDVLENDSDLRNTQYDRQRLILLRLNELGLSPFSVKGLLIKELDSTESDSAGGTRPLIDILTVQKILTKLLFRNPCR